jgi:hypothetical protein
MKVSVAVAVVLLFLAVGCTDATRASISSYGEPHTIKMYNGGVLVAQWESTGKVETMTDSDGWQFMCAKTRKLVRVGGDVIIQVK